MLVSVVRITQRGQNGYERSVGENRRVPVATDVCIIFLKTIAGMFFDMFHLENIAPTQPA